MGTVSRYEHVLWDKAESGMDARVAYGEGAQLLELKVGIVAVLLLNCEPSRPTHLRAGTAQTVGSNGAILEGKKQKNYETPGEMVG